QSAARGERREVGATASASLSAASGSARLGVAIHSFVLAGGPIRLEVCSGAVVISGGDIEFSLAPGSRENSPVGAVRSVLVARGAVRCPPGLQNCLGLAGGDITVPQGAVMEDCTLRSARDVRVPQGAELNRTAVERRVKDVFGPVRFFETARLGVEVTPAKFAVRVSALDAGKAFAKAGLKEGDLVASVNGREAPTPEHFRRLL